MELGAENAAATSGAGALTVLGAIWGSNGQGANVTVWCQEAVDRGDREIVISSDQLGPDPDPQVVKHFCIAWTAKGTTYYRGGKDFERIVLVGG